MLPVMQKTWHIPDPYTQSDFYTDVTSKRLVAFVIDMVITLILTVIAVPLTGFTGLFYLPFLFGVIGFAYRVLTLSSRSATLGMRIMAIEFRDESGRRFDMQLAVLHTLGFYVSVMLPLLQICSVVMMLTSGRGRGLTDMVLHTVLLNNRANP